MRRSQFPFGSALTSAIVPALLALAMSAGTAHAAGNPCDPHTYGAVGDGTIGTNNGTLNTTAIQSAINACAAAGGGIVPISVVNGLGVYLTGPIQLKSHVLLEVNAGATLLGTTDEGQYSIAYLDYPMPGTTDAPPGPAAAGMYAPVAPYEALVFAYQAVDTGIIGTGTINGQGNVTSTSTDRPAGTDTGATRYTGPSYIGTTVGTPTTLYEWWTLPTPGSGVSYNGTTWYNPPQTDIPTSNGTARPWLVEFYECDGVVVNGITLTDSPMWTMVLRYSTNLTITDYHVQNYSNAAATVKASTGPNTDGIDFMGSSYVTITGDTTQNGDDDIAIKSGLPLNIENGMPVTSDPNEIGLPTLPTHDVVITNSTFPGGDGISVGSEASNGVYNVDINNIVEDGTSVGFRIKTGRTRGNYAIGDHDITVQNMTMNNVGNAITMYDYYPSSDGPNETNATVQCTLTVTSNCIDPPQAIQQYTPNVYDITISNVTATSTSQSLVVGVPESCILDVVLNNVNISTSTGGSSGATGAFQLRNVSGTFTNVNVTSTHSPAIAPWVVQENVIATETGGTPFAPGVTSEDTPPLTTTPAGAPCAAYPPGNVYPIGYTP